MKIKIATVQFRIEHHQQEVNLRRIENFIKNASSEEANIIVFPEFFITGPIEGEKEYADTYREHKKVLADFARKYTIDIVTGSLVEMVDKKYYNTSYYINARGEILGMHRKRHLWNTEIGYLYTW